MLSHLQPIPNLEYSLFTNGHCSKASVCEIRAASLILVRMVPQSFEIHFRWQF